MKRLALIAILASTLPAAATQAMDRSAAPPPPPVAAQQHVKAPALIVAISIDQFSADLFAQYRNRFTGGFKRLLDGIVFPSGYQSHAATETCPGHSTILTGFRPARTGIIANGWIDAAAPRADKQVYCAEDESVPGSSSSSYVVSDKHLLVPTLGDRMKAAWPGSRIVSVAGKDRAAVMMGGHRVDELWWWDGKAFVSYAGRAAPDAVSRANAATAAEIARAQPPLTEPDFCRSRDRAITVAPGKAIGNGRLGRAAGDSDAFRVSPAYDRAVLSLAEGLLADMKLGRGRATDLLVVGLSATDYVGHTFGPGGNEMCLQLAGLDRALGAFFETLDRSGVDYAVMLTADHGGLDMPERNRDHAAPTAQRIDAAIRPAELGEVLKARLGLKLPGPLLYGDPGSGDIWIERSLGAGERALVTKELVSSLRAHPQVADVFTQEQIAGVPAPGGPPETWSLVERARASLYPPRSGDVVVALKPRITGVVKPTKIVSAHGSFWDYDRRVPILFWRKDIRGFEQPLSVETVDIMPTLAALVGLDLADPKPDGRCLDLDEGSGSTCPNG